MSWAGLDPGRSKCGLVRSDPGGQMVRDALVLPVADCRRQLECWQRQGLVGVVLGDGTGSGLWLEPLRHQGLRVELVDERGSTLAARSRYWELFPPRGWRRLVPAGLRLPPRDIDDVVAQLLLERWLGRRLGRQVRSGPAR